MSNIINAIFLVLFLTMTKNMNRVYLLAIFKVAVQPPPPPISRTLYGSCVFAIYCCSLQIPWSLINRIGISYSYLQVPVHSSFENIHVFCLKIVFFSPSGQNPEKGTPGKDKQVRYRVVTTHCPRAGDEETFTILP